MTDKIQCELVSWNQFMNLCRDLAFQIKESGFKPDMIVAIGRGGYLPGRILSDYLDNSNLTSFKIEHYKSSHKEPEAIVRYPLSANIAGQKILLVDDVSDSGDTYRAALQHLHQCGVAREIRTVALHYKTVSDYVPDYYAKKIVKWRWLIYPWAVYEDVSGFIKSMSPKPASLDEIERKLKQDYHLTIPAKLLFDIVRLMES